MAELVYAADLKSASLTGLWVRVPSRPPQVDEGGFQMGIKENFMENLAEDWNRRLRSLRISGILLGAVFIVLGLMCIFMPFRSVAFVETVIAIFIFILGIYHLAQYSSTPVLLRRGSEMIAAIFNVILGIFLLTTPDDAMMGFFASVIGFALMVAGLINLLIAGQLRVLSAHGYSWTLAKGLLMVFVALVFWFLPVSSTVTMSVFVGAYLLVSGGSLLIECFSAKDGKTRQRAGTSAKHKRSKYDTIQEGEVVKKRKD